METTTPGSIDVSTSSGLDPGVPVARDTDNTKCVIIRHNTTLNFDAGYEAMPHHLALNIACWFFLLSLFTFLRKRAWNYGRLAIVHNLRDRRWSMAFPSYQNRNHAAASEGIAGHGDTQILTAEEQEAAVELESAATNWIVATWKLKDSHIISRAGADAMQYLSFQRHMIVFMALVTAISLLIILPVNILLGDQEGSPFAITTISNIEKTSAILWLHIIIGISMLPLGILVMRQYTKTLTRTIHEERGAKTLMISHIPRSQCSLQLISQHFHEAYPRMEVTDIQLAYDVQKLTNLNIQKESVTQARLTAEYHFRTTGERMKMAPYHGGYFFGCCCKQVDALEFYLNEELRYSARVEAERLVSLEKPLGIAFVTFKTSQDAQDVKMDLDTWSTYFRKKEPAKSSVSDQLMVSRWNAILAPAPKDIYWENLSFTQAYWITKVLVVNLILFISLFFLTTPTVIVSSVFLLEVTNMVEKLSPLISQSLTTCMVWTFTALLPLMVYYSDQWLGHWRRSSMNYAVMNKCFFFLIFMVIFLPSLGLGSIQALVTTWAESDDNNKVWECIVLPDAAAFFVNYVVTSAFIGTALELVRFPDLLNYTTRMALARSAAEVAGVRRRIQWDFQYGVEYAWMLVIVALVMTYAVILPIITVAGLFYIMLKYFVDRHNIYYVYRPSKISHTIHVQALTLFILSVILLQCMITIFMMVWRGWDTLTIFSFTFGILSMIFFVTNVMFNLCQGISPFLFDTRSRELPEEVTPSHYVPTYPTSGGTPGRGGSRERSLVTSAVGSYLPEVLLSETQLNFKPRTTTWNEDFLADSLNRNYGATLMQRPVSDVIDLDQTHFGITPSSANLADIVLPEAEENGGSESRGVSLPRSLASAHRDSAERRVRDVMAEDFSSDEEGETFAGGHPHTGKKGDTVKLVI